MAAHLATVLHVAGHGSWGRLFSHALAREPDEFIAYMGHSLALLERRGPLHDLDISKDALEDLLVDTVGMWSPRRGS